jgi:hypothetical protein
MVDDESERAGASSSRPRAPLVWSIAQYLQAFGLAFLIIVPALRVEWAPLKNGISNVGGVMRKFSLSQYWGMYAPEATRAMRYIRVTAYYEDGRQEGLVENVEEASGWETQWFWTKRRTSIWRHRLTRDNATRDRIWYLRGVCVRETRRTGETPERVVMEMVRRPVRPPHRVRDGHAVLGKRKVKPLQSMSCAAPVTRDMVEEARGGT